MSNSKNNAPKTNQRATNGSSNSSVTNNPTYAYKSKPNWLFIIIGMLAALVVGLFAGRFWEQKQAGNAQTNTNKAITSDNRTDDASKTTSQSPVLTVEVVKPSKSSIDNDLSADGTISPENTSTVSGKINGVAIEKVLVKEGDQVKKGQVLAVFDNDALNQQLIQANAELAEAKTNFELAKRDANRVLPLLDINAISQQEADRYVATADQAAAAVAASEARLNTQKLNVNNAQVTSPVSGTISKKNAHVGSVPGPEPLFTIIENGKLEWQAQVDPNKISQISVGTPVEVSLPNNKSVSGRVSRISPTAEDGSRNITIYASLNNHPNARAGMYQRGTFKLGSDSKVTIPVSAVVSQDGYDYVMQVKSIKDENRNTIYRVQRIKVSLGERQGDRVVLQEPLSGNGNIVRQGGSFLNDGDIVRIAENTTKTTDK